jgi:hypothetical protein
VGQLERHWAVSSRADHPVDLYGKLIPILHADRKARPGHPVMLDATLRVLAKSEEMAREAETLGSAFIPESAVRSLGESG